VQLEVNQTSQAKTNSASVKAQGGVQNNAELNAKANAEVAKASGTLQPDVVNIGDNKASASLTYDIKTMNRQSNTTDITTDGHTGNKPAAYSGNGSSPESTPTPTVSYVGASGYKPPNPV